MNRPTLTVSGQASEVVASDGSVTLNVPITLRQRSGRRVVAVGGPRGESGERTRTGATPLQLALARGHRWLRMIEAGEFRTPPAGPLGRHWPFDPGLAVVPDPAPIEDDGRAEYEVRLIHRDIEGGGPTTLFYPHNPLDVEGWRGDNFAFTFNIDDYNVIISDSVHLPPTVHLFMEAAGVLVCNFLPKPAEKAPGTERTPWYHRNVDFDEIAFFHGGSLFGQQMPPGLITHAPQGVHHGAPERARERARRKFDDYDTIDWKVIAIDTSRRLVPSPAVLAADLGQHA